MSKSFFKIGALVLCLVSVCCAYAQEFTRYQRVEGVSGNLSSAGSDTLASMMSLWAERFKDLYPNVHIQVQASGSSTAPIALIESTVNIGAMSRPMKAKEREAFITRYGYAPTGIKVAIDALALFVHKDNPLTGISLRELDAVFSATRNCGGIQALERWGQLGLAGSWQQSKIQLFGRNSVSGTYGYFKKKALCKGDFKSQVNEQPGSASVVQAVSTSLHAMGYSGFGYVTSDVKPLAISRQGEEYIAATKANAAEGKYPLSRYLYLYVNKPEGSALASMEAEFIRLVLSHQGQAIVEKEGYVALPPAVAAHELNKLLN